MFNNLTDFSYKRNLKEAIGFYLAYLFLAIILAIILCLPAVISGAININNYKINGSFLEFTAYFVCIYCAIISGLLLTKKKLWNNLGYILLSLLGVLLGISTGLFLGLLIPAFLTTIKPNTRQINKQVS